MRTLCGSTGAKAWVQAVVFAVVAGASWSLAQEPPEYVWRASTLGAELPEVVTPGYTLFTLASDADTSDNLTVFRLLEGTTVEAFAAASDRIDHAFMEGGDVIAVLNEGLAMVDVVGEVSAEPGDQRSVGVVLTEGRYALEYGRGTDGPTERSYHEFRVEGAVGAPAPTPDATVQWADFAFAFPPNLPAGEQTWLVRNVGTQLHHMIIFTLAEGATLDDFIAFMEEMEEAGPPADGAGEPLSVPVESVGIMSAGQESYHVVDLAPGRYVAVCFLPDHLGDATGQPHYMLGMMQVFDVE